MNDILSRMSVSDCSSTMLNMLYRKSTFNIIIMRIIDPPTFSVSLWHTSFRSGVNAVQSIASLANAREIIDRNYSVFSPQGSVKKTDPALI